MREVLRRRFKRLATARAAEKSGDGEGAGVDSFGVVPDLVLIDGGKGQLSAALEVFLEMGIDDVPLASLAKENEELFVPHTPEPIILPRDSQALYLVQRIRDEAHRFAITFHQKTRQKRRLKSQLDSVEGLGPKRRQALLKHFGSVAAVRRATIAELITVPGISKALAERIRP